VRTDGRRPVEHRRKQSTSHRSARRHVIGGHFLSPWIQEAGLGCLCFLLTVHFELCGIQGKLTAAQRRTEPRERLVTSRNVVHRPIKTLWDERKKRNIQQQKTMPVYFEESGRETANRASRDTRKHEGTENDSSEWCDRITILGSSKNLSNQGSLKNHFLKEFFKEPIKVSQKTFKTWFFKAPYLVPQRTFQTRDL